VLNRRELLAGSLGFLAVPFEARGQGSDRIPRIGYLTSEGRSVNVDAFEQGLTELGYRIGQDVTIEYRFAERRIDLLPSLATEILRFGVDVFFAASPYALRAVTHATRTMPIVGIDLESDPVAEGWVKSIARPAGNVTGFFLDVPELSTKELQLLAATVSRLRRVAVIWDRTAGALQFKAIEEAGHAVGLTIVSLPFEQPQEFVASFDEGRRQQVSAVVILTSPAVFSNLRRLADIALERHLPSICVFPQFAEAGGLMGYGPVLPDLFRQGASYVARILKGARPAELPVQRPVVFRLALNARTARTLGVTFPQSVLLRAEQVIE
jgi:putative ABC transport system substrate-binding protein